MKADLSPYWTEQYQLVLVSRNVFLEYCSTISPEDLLTENSSFGRGGSIRNLLVHIANTYEFWIAKHALKKDIAFTPYGSKESIIEIKTLFEDIDRLMLDFITRYGDAPFQSIHFEINGVKKSTEPFKLFTHVITHEFHHKGQILSISRHLGYIPVDTDIMR